MKDESGNAKCYAVELYEGWEIYNKDIENIQNAN
jgi:hypothetical protein